MHSAQICAQLLSPILDLAQICAKLLEETQLLDLFRSLKLLRKYISLEIKISYNIPWHSPLMLTGIKSVGGRRSGYKAHIKSIGHFQIIT